MSHNSGRKKSLRQTDYWKMSSNVSSAGAAGLSTPVQSYSLSWDNFDYAAIKLNVNEVNGIIELNLDF